MPSKNKNGSGYRTSILMDVKLNTNYAKLYMKKDKLNLPLILDVRITNASDLFNKSLFLGFKVIIGKVINKKFDEVTIEDIEEALK